MTLFGLDYLAGAKYRKELLAAHKPGFAAGFFANTFGDVWPTIDALAKTGKCPLIRVHGVWSDTHTFGRESLNLAVREARKCRQYAARYPQIEFRYSPYCEHNLNEKEMLAVMHEVQQAAGPVRLVNTPWRGAILKNFINEVHGDHPTPAGEYFYSYDGTACVDSDVEMFKAKHSKADVFFFWTYQLNLKYNEKDTTPRPLRKVIPPVKLLKSLNALAGPKGECSLPKQHLFKSHAEQSDWDGDKRSSKPCFITPVKAEKLTLVSKGKVLATLTHYGQFVDGRERYYASVYGYEISTEPVEIRQGKKVLGVVNPAFRQNDYRNK